MAYSQSLPTHVLAAATFDQSTVEKLIKSDSLTVRAGRFDNMYHQNDIKMSTVYIFLYCFYRTILCYGNIYVFGRRFTFWSLHIMFMFELKFLMNMLYWQYQNALCGMKLTAVSTHQLRETEITTTSGNIHGNTKSIDPQPYDLQLKVQCH